MGCGLASFAAGVHLPAMRDSLPHEPNGLKVCIQYSASTNECGLWIPMLLMCHSAQGQAPILDVRRREGDGSVVSVQDCVRKLVPHFTEDVKV